MRWTQVRQSRHRVVKNLLTRVVLSWNQRKVHNRYTTNTVLTFLLTQLRVERKTVHCLTFKVKLLLCWCLIYKKLEWATLRHNLIVTLYNTRGFNSVSNSNQESLCNPGYVSRIYICFVFQGFMTSTYCC